MALKYNCIGCKVGSHRYVSDNISYEKLCLTTLLFAKGHGALIMSNYAPGP